VFACDQDNASSVAVGPTTVAWSYDTSPGDFIVADCSTSGCAQTPTTVTSGTTGANIIAVDSNNVYFNLQNYALLGCPISGPCTNGTLYAKTSLVLGLAVDAQSVYWADTTAGTVNKCPIIGCGTSPTVLASGQNLPGQLVVDATDVYWSPNNSGLLRCALTGCGGQPTTLATGAVMGFAIDSTSAYWNTGSGVMTCNLASCTPKPFSIIDAAPFASDGSFVYLTQSTAILKCPVGDCSAPTSLVTTTNSGPLTGAALGASDVFFSLRSMSSPATAILGIPK